MHECKYWCNVDRTSAAPWLSPLHLCVMYDMIKQSCRQNTRVLYLSKKEGKWNKHKQWAYWESVCKQMVVPRIRLWFSTYSAVWFTPVSGWEITKIPKATHSGRTLGFLVGGSVRVVPALFLLAALLILSALPGLLFGGRLLAFLGGWLGGLGGGGLLFACQNKVTLMKKRLSSFRKLHGIHTLQALFLRHDTKINVLSSSIF